MPENTYGNYLYTDQVQQLLKAVHPARVFETQGMSNMAAYEIKAHLNRIFGFGRWSADVISMELIYETPTMTRGYNGQPGKPAFNVAYRAGMTLTVKSPTGVTLATYTEYAVGEATMPDFKRGDAHDMAIKTAESQALKRCAINLGDQFGLSLYAKNAQLKPLVRGVIVGLPAPEVVEEHDQVTEDVDPDHPEELPERDVNQEPVAPEPVAEELPPAERRARDLKLLGDRIAALSASDQEALKARWRFARLPKLGELDGPGFGVARKLYEDLVMEIAARDESPTGGDYAEPPEGYEA